LVIAKVVFREKNRFQGGETSDKELAQGKAISPFHNNIRDQKIQTSLSERDGLRLCGRCGCGNSAKSLASEEFGQICSEAGLVVYYEDFHGFAGSRKSSGAKV